MNDIDREWGRRVKQARTEHDLTQHQLAAIMGVDQSRVSRIETGDASMGIHDLAALSRVFGVDFTGELIATLRRIA